MASLGQAWAQGQRNAQEAAMNKVSTLMNLAKTAAEADQYANYFTPLEKESRARATDIKKAKLEAIKDIDKFSKEFYSNPKEAAKKMLKQQYGGDFDIVETPTGINAVEKVTAGQPARTLNLGGSYDQMLDALIKEKYFSSEEKIANTVTRADAEKAARMKTQEKILEETAKAQAQYTWGGQQKLKQEDIANQRTTAASRYGSQMSAMSGIEQANIGMGLRGLDATKFAADTAAKELGMTWDEASKDYVGTVNVNGSPTPMLLKDMPNESKVKFATVYKGALAGFSNPVDPSTGQRVHPFLSSQAGAQAARRALEQAGIPATPGSPGIPVKTAPVDPYAQWRPAANPAAPGGIISWEPSTGTAAQPIGLPTQSPYTNQTPRY